MTIARDGAAVSANASTGTVVTSTLTTSNGSGEIVVAIGSNAASITSVTAVGLTFTLRAGPVSTFGWNIMSEYVAPYTTNFSGVITVVVVSAAATSVIAQAYSGVPTSAPFDGTAATSTNPPASKTTTNANDVVISINSLSSSAGSAGSGWTLVANPAFLLMQDQIVSSTGTFTGNDSGSLTNGNIVDAMVAAAGGAVHTPTLTILGAG